MMVLLKSSVNQTKLRNNNDYTKGDLSFSLLFENDLCLCQLPQMQNHFYRITFVFSEASGKTMVFIIFRRRDHYPELCSRHGASLHENSVVFFAFFMRKKRARARDTRTMGEGPTRPLRVSLARKTRENRTVISVFFFVPLSVFYSLKETSYCLSTGCLVKNCSTCNDGFVRITYSLARRRLQANKNFTVCKPCNQTEKGRMKAKMPVIDRDESKCPPGQKDH